ncbi:mCG147496 [Mus musculus]|nr:mCG147496 [Mus musculus]
MALLAALQTKVIRETERVVETIAPAPTASAHAHQGGRGAPQGSPRPLRRRQRGQRRAELRCVPGNPQLLNCLG